MTIGKSEQANWNSEQERRARLISAAWQKAHCGTAHAEQGLVVWCPDCRTPAEITEETPLTDIKCVSCGSHFGLVTDDTDLHVGQKIDCFELMEFVGRGGFGCVWKAHDTELDRIVAIKVPRAGRLSAEDSEQFFREARAAAQLRHPNIVSVHRIGSDENTFFIVSDLVDGESLAEWLAIRTPGFREAAQLCEKLARALHHAHEFGVIHRDVKPQNILIDREAEPYLTDFGLARRELGEATMTFEGHILGTPAFMSPEQANGDSHRANRQSDVYSLGVVLFQLLTGELPFRGTPRMVIEQVVRDEAPSLRRLNSTVPRDLENIALKCLEKDAEQRYETAKELALDLRRYREGRPVRARPISSAARLVRWCRRRPATSLLIVALLVSGLMLSVGGPMMAMRQSRLANEYRHFLYLSDLQSAADAISSGDLMRAANLLETYASKDRKELRTFEWHLLWLMCQHGITTPDLWTGYESLPPDAKAARSIDYSPQGDLAAIHFDGSVTIWRDGQLLHRRDGHFGYGQSVAFSSDGQLLASGGSDRTVRIWEVETGRALQEISVGLEPWSLAFLDAEHLSIPGNDGVMRYHASTGRYVGVIPNTAMFMGQVGNAAGRLTVSLDRSLMALVDRNRVRVLDLRTNEVRGVWEGDDDESSRMICFSSDNRYLIRGGTSAKPSVRIWDIKAGRLHCELHGHENSIRAVSPSPQNADIVVTAGWDKYVKLWSISKKAEVATLVGHSGQLYAMDVSPDGQSLVSGGIDGRLRMWRFDKIPATRLLGDSKPVTDVTFHPSGALLTASTEGVIVWDAKSGSLRDCGPDVASPSDNRVVCAPDGSTYSTFAHAEEALLVDYDTQKVRHRLPHESKLNCLAYAPDGELLATGSLSGDITIWETDSGKRVASWCAHRTRDRVSERVRVSNTNHWGHPDIVHDVRFLDARRLISVGGDRRIKLWRIETDAQANFRLREVRSQTMNDQFPRRLAYSRDRDLLALSDEHGQPSLWRGDLSERIKTWDAVAQSGISSLVFVPSQNTLITGGYEGDLRFWDANATTLRMTLLFDSVFNSIAISPNCDRLAFNGTDGVVHLLMLR